MQQDVISFGPFTMQRQQGLSRAGKPVDIGQKALAVLWELARAAGQSVSKDQLMAACWPGLTVEEGNLTVQVAALRKVLGSSDDGLNWIVTVPRVGYRLLWQGNAPKTEAAEGPPARSIAVLPFRNLSVDPENAYFAAGLSAEITSALARYRSLTVHSVNTIEESGEDARTRAAALGVAFLVEGQAMRNLDKLRVVASLIDGDSGVVMWNQRFDAEMADIFDVQDQIAATVAAHVEPAISNQDFELARRKASRNPSVYEMYLKACHLQMEGSIGSVTEAYDLLQRALQQHPDDARANGMICEILLTSLASGFTPFLPDGHKTAEHYARRSIELAGGDSRILARGAVALLHVSNDIHRILASAEQAYAANPNDWEVANIAATVQLHCGEIDVAVERYGRAIRLGPVSPESRFSRTGLAHAHIVMGQFEHALEQASSALSVSTGFSITYWMLIAASAHLDRMEAARKWLDEMSAKWPKVTVASIRAGQPKFKPERIEPILRGLALAGMPEV